MLNVIPLSWISAYSWSTSEYNVLFSDEIPAGASYLNTVFAYIGDREAYQFSLKPLQGLKDFAGNNDVFHYQVHGQASLVGRDLEDMVIFNPLRKGTAKYNQVFGAAYGDSVHPLCLLGSELTPMPRTDGTARYTGIVCTNTTPPSEITASIDNGYLAFFYGCVGNVYYSIKVSGTYKFTRSPYVPGKVQFVPYIFTEPTFVPLVLTSDKPLFKYSPDFMMNLPIWEHSLFTKNIRNGKAFQLSLTSSNASCWIDGDEPNHADVGKRLDAFFKSFVTDLVACLPNAIANRYVYSTGNNLQTERPPSLPKYLMSSEILDIRTELRAIAENTSPSHDDYDYRLSLSEATRNAVDRTRSFDGNLGVYLKELTELKESVESLIGLLEGEASPKNIASLYLAMKYGLKLTLQDSLEIGKGIERAISNSSSSKRFLSVSRGTAECGEFLSHCKLYYDAVNNSKVTRVINALYRWDLFITLENVWDIVPYSFVVDWFIDVSNILSAIDSRTMATTMNIFRVVYSTKCEWVPVVHLTQGYLTGNLTFTYYERWSDSEPITIIPSFSGGQPSKHVLEGAALIIQNL